MEANDNLPNPREGNTMSEDITRLPKWAQTKIEVLEMRVREARDRETAMFANPADTDTLFFDAYHYNPRPLPKGTRVRFLLGKHALDVYVGRSGEFVEVYTIAGHPVILPWMGNIFHVEVKA